jgi:hypothetical protein
MRWIFEAAPSSTTKDGSHHRFESILQGLRPGIGVVGTREQEGKLAQGW